MSFVTWGYYALLLCAVAAYALLPGRLRWGVLLACSLWFCALLGADTLLWMGVATAVSYAGALLIHRWRGTRRARLCLWVSLALCFGLLVVFKYLGFGLRIVTRAAWLLGLDHTAPAFSLALPVGISFYVFQVTGYLADVYRGACAPVRHAGHYALAVSFFPKLMQGPIEPVAAFAEQVAHIKEEKPFDERGFCTGMMAILLGLAQKTLVADRLARVVDQVYAAPAQGGALSTWSALIAMVFYAFQLYADFAGYTSIALGSAQLFGLRLSPNFHQPYLARSIADFWRRWHITLSAWLRQNVYFPLGGSRVSAARWRLNVLAVFLVSGLWHGAGLNFIVWGLLHGVYQIAGRLTESARRRLKQRWPARLSDAVSVACTFALVCVAWVFFRALNVAEAMTVLRGLLAGGAFSLAQLGATLPEFLCCLLAVAGMITLDACSARCDAAEWLASRSLGVRWLLCLTLLALIMLFGYYGSLSASSFLYVGF